MRLSRIAVHPIKGLDPHEPERVSIAPNGGLEGDRGYAMADDYGAINGKRTTDVHRIRAAYDDSGERVTLWTAESERRRFHLEDDRGALEEWLSEFFDHDLELETARAGAQTEYGIYGDGTETGPTLVSRATLETVAGWYDGVDAEEMRARMRPNLVVEGVPPFWEDGLVADGGRRFRIGDVVLEGVESVPRCVIPQRDPRTGEVTPDFRETFERNRRETLPEWVDLDGFNDWGGGDAEANFYSLMAIARIPRDQRDGQLAIGDPITVEGPPIVE